jgi:hypothetical protein
MFNEEYEADAYDITCRICDDWQVENVSPTIAGMHMMRHSDHHDTSEIGGPWWAMRVVAGYKGHNPDNPDLEPSDGWNRSPTLEVSSDA